MRVAIDGPSGAGKSTLARAAAKELGFVYVDTGAMYRAIALFAYRAGVDAKDAAGVEALLPQIRLDMDYDADGEQRMLLNGEDVSREIRKPVISMYTSDVSAIPAVRAFLLERQRQLAREKSVLMDGRDIGTVVLPDAEVKIFLTAAPEARARRRRAQLLEKGDAPSLDEVLRDVIARDHNDMTRAVSPLRQAEDARVLDTTELDFDQSLKALIAMIREGETIA